MGRIVSQADAFDLILSMIVSDTKTPKEQI